MTKYEKLSLRFLDGIFASLVLLIQAQVSKDDLSQIDKQGLRLFNVYKDLHSETSDAFDK